MRSTARRSSPTVTISLGCDILVRIAKLGAGECATPAQRPHSANSVGPRKMPPLPIKDLVFRAGVLAALLALAMTFASSDGGFCNRETATAIEHRSTLNCAEYWLNRYQSLIGGVATLFGAILAFYAVQRQLSQNEKLEDDRRSREADAARSALPLSLSVLADYALNCIEILRDAIGSTTPNQPPIQLPAFPANLVSNLQDNIRYGSDIEASELAELLKVSQIQNARARNTIRIVNKSLTGNYRNTHLQSGLFDACDLFTRAGKQLEQSRGAFKPTKVIYSDYENTANLANLDLDQLSALRRRFERASADR